MSHRSELETLADRLNRLRLGACLADAENAFVLRAISQADERLIRRLARAADPRELAGEVYLACAEIEDGYPRLYVSAAERAGDLADEVADEIADFDAEAALDAGPAPYELPDSSDSSSGDSGDSSDCLSSEHLEDAIREEVSSREGRSLIREWVRENGAAPRGVLTYAAGEPAALAVVLRERERRRRADDAEDAEESGSDTSSSSASYYEGARQDAEEVAGGVASDAAGEGSDADSDGDSGDSSGSADSGAAGAADAKEDEDPWDLLLGGYIPAKRQRVKTRPAAASAYLAAENRAAEAEAQADLLEAAEGQLELLRDLLDDSGVQPPAAPEDAALPAFALAIEACRSQLAERIRARPDLKRARDEREALGEIRAEQRDTRLVINPWRFGLLVQEVVTDVSDWRYGPRHHRFEPEAVAALQAAAEDYLVRLFDSANLLAIHAGRELLVPKDVQLARRLGGEN